MINVNILLSFVPVDDDTGLPNLIVNNTVEDVTVEAGHISSPEKTFVESLVLAMQYADSILAHAI